MLDKFPTLARLTSDCAPFVQRAFRGARFKRYAAINAILVALTLLSGIWLALGSGSMERDFRESIGVEVPHWERQEVEFNAILFDPVSYDELTRERARLAASGSRPHDLYNIGWMIRDGEALVAQALITPVPYEHRALAARAASMVEQRELQVTFEEYQHHYFSWEDPRAVERLSAVVDADLLPSVELYRSPLSSTDAIGVVGSIAGFFSILLLLVVGPLLGGAQLAQEAHENTLPPLLGTRLSARSLVLGLTAGAMSLAVFLAVPQLALFFIAAVLAGNAVAGVAMIFATAASAAVLVMLAQMLGLGMGRRWASGLVGVTLCGALGMAMFAGAGFGWNITETTSGMINLLPHAGPNYLLVETFFPSRDLYSFDLALTYARVVFTPVAFIGLAIVATRALERRIANRTQSSITRGEGLVAAGLVVGLAVMAMPDFNRSDAQAVYFLSLGAAMFPFAVLIAGRVAVGEGPSHLRKLPLRALLAEFAGFIGLHAVIALCAVQFELEFSIVGCLFLGWTVAVVALVAVRSVAMPLRLPAAFFSLFSLGAAMLQFILAVAAFDAVHRSSYAADRIGAELFEFSPLLGLTQLAVLFLVPIILVRSLRKGTAGFE